MLRALDPFLERAQASVSPSEWLPIGLMAMSEIGSGGNPPTDMSARETLLSRAAAWGLDAGLYGSVAVVTLLYSALFVDNVLAKGGVLLILGGLLVLFAGARCIGSRRLSLLRLPIYLPFLCFVVWASMSAGLSGNAHQGVESLLSYAVPFCLFAVVVHRCRTIGAMVRLLWVVVLTNMVVSVIGLLQYAGLDPLSMPSAAAGMPVSTLGNRNFAAYYHELLLPVLAAILISQWGMLSRIRRSVLLVSLVMAAAHLVVTGSRAGWLSAVVSLVLLLTLTAERRRWLRHAPSFILAGLLLLPIGQFLLKSIPLEDDESLYTPASRTARETWDRALTAFDPADFSRAMRILVWAGTSDMIGAAPWFGAGPGQYWISMRPHLDHMAWGEVMKARTEEPHEARHAHNEYLEFSAEIGLVGLGILIWWLGSLLWTGHGYLRLPPGSAQKSFARPVRAMTAGIVCGIIASLIHACFAFNLHNPVALAHLWVLAGLMVAVNSRKLSDREHFIDVSLQAIPRAAGVGVVAAAVAALLCMTGWRILLGDYHYARGHEHMAAGKADRAISSLNEAADWRGHEFRYHRLLGRIALMRGDDEEAEASLERSLDLHPNDPGALRLLGGILVRSGRNATEALARAVLLDPLNTRAYSLLAQAYRRVGQHDLAIASLQRALEADPQDAQLLVALALAHRDAGKWDACISTLETAAGLKPEDGRIAGNLGAVYLEMGRPVQAEEQLRRALRFDRHNEAKWQANLSQALKLQGRDEEAKAAAYEAVIMTQDSTRREELRRVLEEQDTRTE